jgi:uncharacterized repeat protein (TIGR02543 family)
MKWDSPVLIHVSHCNKVDKKLIRKILSSKARVAVSLLVSLAILITGVTPAHATHLRGAVGYIKYDSVAKTITINSTMVERKDACPPATANTNLSSAQGSQMPSGGLCTFFAFPSISAVDRTTGTVTNVSPCAGQATSPASWYYNVTAEPLYNIFNTVYVINAACPNFNTNLDYIFSQTGSNRIGGIKNTTNQVIQFEGRVRLDQSRTTPIYNSGYMTNVAYIDPAVNPNYIYSTNLNALDEGGRAVTYSLITSSAAALGGYGATPIPCSDLNTTTGEFRLGYKLCLPGENYVTSFSGGNASAPINWALKTKATDANGQYVTRDVLLSFAGSTNNAPTISPTSQTLNVANGGTTSLVLQGRDADAGQTLSFSTNGLPSWATLTTNNTTNTAGNATLSINAAGISNVAQVIQVSVTDNSAFQLSATATITVNIGSAVLPPNAPTVSASANQGSTYSSPLNVTFSPATSGGTPTSFSIVATPVGGGTPITVSYTPSGSAPYTVSIPGATSGTFYSITVTGTNSMGSAASAPYVPATPTLSVSPTSLNFTQGVSSSPTLTYVSASPTATGYSQTGLPAGLSFNTTTGQITGTATAAPGTYNVAVTGNNGASVTVSVVISNKASQTITANNIGSAPTLTSVPTFTSTAPGTIPAAWTPLGAYATSGLPVSYSLTSNGTYISAASPNGTNQSAAISGSSSRFCYLAVYGGIVYAMAAQTGTARATSCTIYVSQAGNSSYSAATALTNGSTTLNFKLYVSKFTTPGLAPKYMFFAGTTSYNATLPSLVYYVGDNVNHPFNLCPTTGTTTTATCTSFSSIAYTNTSTSTSNQWGWTSCATAGANAAVLPSQLKMDATTGCELSGVANSTLAPTVFTLTLTNAAGSQVGSTSTPKLQFTLEVRKRPQTVASFTQPSDMQIVAGSAVTQNLVATSNSGNGVTFTSSDPSRCSINGAVVTVPSGATAGTCVITPSVAETTPYYASTNDAAMAKTITVRPAGAAPVLTLNGPQSQTVLAMSTQTDLFPITYSGAAPVEWRFTDTPSGTTSILPPDGLAFDTTTGKLYGMPEAAQDFATYYVSAKSSTNQWSTPITVRLRITLNPQTITFAPLHGAVVGDNQPLTASTDSNLLISFTTNNSAICTIVNGYVHAVAVGTCTVTASQPGNGTSYAPAQSQTQSFTIASALLAPVISLSSAAATVQAGEYLLPLFDIYNSGGDLGVNGTTSIFTLDTGSDPLPSGVSFDPYWGVFTGRPMQSSPTLHFVIKACNATGCSTATFALTITKKQQPVTITPQYNTLLAPNSMTVTATSISGLTITLTSTTPSVCTYSAGRITAVANGTCVIHAAVPGDSTYEPGTGDKEIQITQIPTLSLTNGTVVLWNGASAAGRVYSLTNSGTPDARTSYRLMSGATDISSVGVQGLTFDSATGLLSGTANWDPTSPVNTAATYSITATNQYGTSTAVTFTLKVLSYFWGTIGGGSALSNTDPLALVNNVTLAVGAASTNIATISGAPSGSTYALASDSDALPAGLSLDPATGTISGSATANVATRTIRVVATAGGLVSYPLSLAISTTATVTYNSNTGTGTAPSDTNVYAFGDTVTTLTNTFSKSSNTFLSWNTAADGSGLSYREGVTLAMGSSNLTLYAIWKPNSSFVVTFDSNYPNGQYLTRTQIASNTTALSANTFSYVGYTFAGWSGSRSGSVTYANSANYAFTSTTTLYAIWNVTPVNATVVNNTVTGITTKAADLNATLTTGSGTSLANGDVLDVKLCYSTTNGVDGAGKFNTSNCSSNLWDPTASVGVAASRAFVATTASLSANTQYWMQIQVSFANTTYKYSTPTSFTTLDVPAAVTLAPISVSARNATIQGQFNPKGNKVNRVYFCWGLDLAEVSACTRESDIASSYTWLGGGDNNNNVFSLPLTGLLPGRQYYYKVLGDVDDRATLSTMSLRSRRLHTGTVVNGSGTQSFTTASGDTVAASPVAGTTATLKGTVNGGTAGLANGDVTNVKLCWSYSNAVDPVTGNLTTPLGCSGNLWLQSSSIAANGSLDVSYALTSLASSTQYFSQLQVTFAGNAPATAAGSALGFVTLSTITFHSNPPAFVNGADTTNIQTATGTATLNNNAFSISGLTFAGWTTNSDGTGTAYANAGSITVASDVDLFAKWTINTYTLDYAANNGTWTSGSAPANATVEFGATATGAQSTVIGRTGYTFAGWTSTINGSPVLVGSGSTFTMPAANVTLTASWTANTYTVTYSANGGTGSAPSQGSYTVGGLGITLPGAGSLQNTGFTFGGWSTSPTGTTALPSPYAPSATGTLYAIWVPANANTVTYHSAYPVGSSLAGADTTSAQSANQSTQLTGTFTAPTGYVLTGWVDGSNPPVPYALTATYNFAANLDLYAVWSQVSYTVTYAPGSGTVGSSPAPTEPNHNYGDSLTLAANNFVAPTGNAFTGWNDGSALYTAGQQITMHAHDMVFTAVWALQSYALTYTLNGASWISQPAANQTYGTQFHLPSANTMSKPGYTFGGWSVGGITLAGGANFTMPANAVTLSAIWTADTYTVTYDANSATGAPTVATDSYTVDQQNPLSLTSVGTMTYVQNGLTYTFGGWSESQSVLANLGLTYRPTSDITLFAIWNPPVSHTITFHSNYPSNTLSSSTLAQNGYVTEAIVMNFAVPSGYHFGGWENRAIGAQPSSYTLTGNYNFASGDADLYATWVANTYVITYNSNGATGGSSQYATQNYTFGTSPIQVSGAGSLVKVVNGVTYIFSGWATSVSSTTSVNLLTYTTNGDVELFAIWQEPGANTVTYHSNYALSMSMINTTQTQSGNGLAALSATFTAPAGYVFNGWVSNIANTTADYTASSQYDFATGPMDLWALWIPGGNKTLTLHSNFSPSVDAVVTQQAAVTTPIVANPFSRNGYSFLYWTTNRDGSGNQYSDGGNFDFLANSALWAQWQANYVPEPLPVPQPEPKPVPKPLEPLVPITVTPPAAPLTAVTLLSGAPISANLAPTAAADGLALKADDWTLNLAVKDLAGNSAPLDNKNRVVAEAGQYAHASGTGFRPNAPVNVYIFSTPILLGILMTDENGNFTGELPVPTGLAIGDHLIQVNGYAPEGDIRSASIPVVVQAPVGKVVTAKFYFKPNSSWISAANRAAIKKVASSIKAGYTDLNVGAVGFVYPFDTKKANLQVSSQRAKNVVALLKQFGLNGLFVAKGAGRADVSNKTARRVDLTITYQVNSTGN